MVHDYTSGIHSALVEAGGFLRNGLGLSHDQWIHLIALERANMVAHHTVGTPNYMHFVRQRAGAIGSADTTDANAEQKTAESETPENDMEVDVTGSADVHF